MKRRVRNVLSLCLAMVLLLSCMAFEGMALSLVEHIYTYGNYQYGLGDGDTRSYATIKGLVKQTKTLTIPAYVDGIPVAAVSNSLLNDGGFEGFVVEPENLFLKVVDGILYDRSGEVLIRVPVSYKGTLNIPQGVTIIGPGAALNCVNITKVNFPKSLKTIDYNGFKGCDGLRSVSLPEGLQSIGFGGFAECDKLEIIDIPDGVKPDSGVFDDTLYVSKQSNWKNGVLFVGNHLISAKKLTDTTYFVPKGTVSIGDSAFSGLKQLKKIVIPESVAYIGWEAFSGCYGLETIVMPQSGCQVEERAFSGIGDRRDLSVISQDQKGVFYGTLMAGVPLQENKYIVPEGVTAVMNGTIGSSTVSANQVILPASLGCFSPLAMGYANKVKEIRVNEENPYYTSIDGVVYDKQVTTLICCPGGKTSVTVPQSVTAIGDYAFYGCKNLTQVVLPDGLKTIGERAFYCCIGLREVHIPEGVSQLNLANAFIDCTNLEKITLPEGLTRLTFPSYRSEKIVFTQIPYGVQYIAPGYLKTEPPLRLYSNSFALEFAKEYGVNYKITKEGPKPVTSKVEKPIASSPDSSVVPNPQQTVSSAVESVPQEQKQESNQQLVLVETPTNVTQTPTDSVTPQRSPTPWVWIACGGGVVILGAIAFWFWQKKKTK